MAKKTADAGKKWKKQWFAIVAPAVFNSVQVGETPANEPANLVGRLIKVNMFSLTGDIKKQYVRVVLKVKEVKDTKAITDVVGYELSSAHVKRLGKKTGTKLEDSFVLEGKDKIKLRIKPLVLTRKKVQRSVGSAILKQVRELILQRMKEKDLKDAILSITRYDLQKGLKKDLSKIYPIASCEIKKLDLI